MNDCELTVAITNMSQFQLSESFLANNMVLACLVGEEH